MENISKEELKVFMNLFHKDFDPIYKEKLMGFSTDGYISNSFAGVIFRVEETPIFETKIIELSDDEICDMFKKHTGRNIKNSDAYKEHILNRDARGFTKRGWWLLKGLEGYKWNIYTAIKDLNDMSLAILEAGK